MATSPSTVAALEAYLDKRFSEFEDRTCLLFCQISTGTHNRIVKETNILTRHIQELQERVRLLEAGGEEVPVSYGSLVEERKNFFRKQLA